MYKFDYRRGPIPRLPTVTPGFMWSVLIGITLASLWLMTAPGILSGSSSVPAITGPLAGADAAAADDQASELLPGVRLLNDFQTSQPRDPFRPLLTEDNGDPTNGGFDPGGTTVSLVSVTTLSDGTRQAVVRVSGVDYTVQPGDTFAGAYQVVTLTDDGGTFLFGDSPFTLAVGEEILK